MKYRLKKKNLMLIILVVIILIGGLSTALIFKNKDTNNSTLDSKNDIPREKEPEVVIPQIQIVDINSKSRPYAVMINNIGAARPYHTGLQNAYLVYELMVEGGITRYLALFKDNLPSEVGSVRSARHYYLDYVMENDAYYVHWGWSPKAQSDIKTLKINNLNGLTYGSPYFFRKKLNVSSEHTGYVNLSEMPKLSSQKKYRETTNTDLLLNYSAMNVNLESAQDALKIDLKYSSGFITNYAYDKDSNSYKQSVNNKAHTDYKTKEQYTVKNIIVYKLPYKTIDNYGRQDIENIGSGEGYFITGGKYIEITWEKKTREDQTIYKDLNGKEITVNDGNTWIHILPTNGNITIN